MTADALSGLANLGFKEKDALAAIEECRKDAGEGPQTLETLLYRALALLHRSRTRERARVVDGAGAVDSRATCRDGS